jgi:hypothetical protein
MVIRMLGPYDLGMPPLLRTQPWLLENSEQPRLTWMSRYFAAQLKDPGYARAGICLKWRTC